MSSEEVPAEILHDFERNGGSYVEEGYDEAPSQEDDIKPATPMNDVLFHKDEPSAEAEVMAEENSVVMEDGTVDMPAPDLQSAPSTHITTVVRRVVRRLRVPHEDESGPSSSIVPNSPRKIYVRSLRRKKTPEEELELRFEGNGSPEKRAPAPPGKRGRRPIMLPLEHTEPVARSEAARRTGRPVVIHPSGVEFVIPSSLEAHPIQLSDIIPENPAFDILKDDEAMPYCSQCHSVLRTFHALEYHAMSVHLKYRPYRCMFCVKEYFYTEDEAISHLKSAHIGKPIHIIRELKEDKEEMLAKFFQTIFLMVREGEELTQQRVEGLQQAAYQQMQKYHRLRFKVPEVVARQRSQKEVAAQTFVTMAAPQTMVQMPVVKSPQYGNVRREPSIIGNVKMVQLPNGEIVRQVVTPENRRYILNRDMEIAEHEAYNIDVVEDELDHHVHY